MVTFQMKNIASLEVRIWFSSSYKALGYLIQNFKYLLPDSPLKA